MGPEDMQFTCLRLSYSLLKCSEFGYHVLQYVNVRSNEMQLPYLSKKVWPETTSSSTSIQFWSLSSGLSWAVFASGAFLGRPRYKQS